MFMRTERLMLRPIFPEDWREVFAGIADESVVRMLARAPWPYRPADARAFCNLAADPREPRFLVTLPGSTGAPVIGGIGIERKDDGRFELGYWIGRKWQRCGYATEAVKGMLETARALGIAELDARHFVDNPASGKVLARCGFTRIGGQETTISRGRGGVAVPSICYTRDLSAAGFSQAA